jgi:hypothetical protein
MLNIIRAVVVLVLLFDASAFMGRTWWLTLYPHELDFGEGLVLWQAAHVFTLREAYHPIQHFPYMVFSYPPVYHALSRLAGLITGDLLRGGRALTFFCTLASALTVAGIAWSAVPGSRIRRSMAALVAALLILRTPSLTWAPNMRVDLTAIFLTLLGFLVVMKWDSRRATPIAAVLFVAAVFTKQTMIAAPLAAVLMLVVAGCVRRAVILVTTMVGLGLTVAVVLSTATDGEFLRHIIRYNQNPFSVRQLVLFLGENLSGMSFVGLLALSLPLVLLGGRVSLLRTVTAWRNGAPDRSGRDWVAWGTVTYALFAFVVSFTAGKSGAWYNYFLEWNIVCCALAGIVVGRTWRQSRGVRMGWSVVLVWLLVGAAAADQLRPSLKYLHMLRGTDAQWNQQVQDADLALAAVRSVNGPVLSEDMVLLVKAGKDIPWEPAIVTELAKVGLWDETPAIAMLDRRVFDLIVVRKLDDTRRYSPRIRLAIEQAYYVAQRIGESYVVMRPRPG